MAISKTIESDILHVCNTAKSKNELMNRLQPIIQNVLATDNALLSVQRSKCGYGTWRIQLFVNEYHFGNELTTDLLKLCITTNNEDKVFSISDFEDQITEYIENFAYFYFN